MYSGKRVQGGNKYTRRTGRLSGTYDIPRHHHTERHSTSKKIILGFGNKKIRTISALAEIICTCRSCHKPLKPVKNAKKPTSRIIYRLHFKEYNAAPFEGRSQVTKEERGNMLQNFPPPPTFRMTHRKKCAYVTPFELITVYEPQKVKGLHVPRSRSK